MFASRIRAKAMALSFGVHWVYPGLSFAHLLVHIQKEWGLLQIYMESGKCYCAHSVIIICRCPTSSLDYSSWLLLKRLELVLFTLALEQSVHLGHSMCQTMWWRPKGGPLKRLSGNSAQLSSLEWQVYPTKSVNNISTATQKCFIWHIESGSRSDTVAVWWDCAAFAPVLVLAVF